jgi:transcriptional regulator with PAS, ATPase and Fis domain
MSGQGRNDKEKVADELKISLSTLYRKLERYNLKV